MQRQSPKALFIEPIKELRARAMDHITVHGRPMVLGEEFNSLVQSGSGKAFALLAFTGDYLRLMSTCLLADRRLDPLEVQFLFPLVRPACRLYGKYRTEYLQFANINRGNIHDFLTFYDSDTALFGFRCPVTRWAGITIANNVAEQCGDTSFQVIARDHYSRFGDALREVSGGQEQEVALIIENMLSHFESSTAEGDDDMEFEIDFDASPAEMDDGLEFAVEHVYQSGDGLCAIASQQMILKRFGIDKSEDDLADTAREEGWLKDTDGDGIPGTLRKHASKLLEHYGVATHEGYANSSQDLFDELRKGRLVIVGVDSGELWEPDSIKEALEDVRYGERADHAVVVVGVDQTDPDNPLIVINDPGRADGGENHIPLPLFLNAWNDSDNHFVATDNPPPNLARDPILGRHFDEEKGEYGGIFLTALALGGPFLSGMAGQFVGKWIYDNTLGKWVHSDKQTK